MDNIFVVAAILSFLFFVAKFLEMKYIDKDESKGIKFLLRDSLVVYICAVLGLLLVDQLKPLLKDAVQAETHTMAFTDNAPF
jgi:hypothetical protein